MLGVFAILNTYQQAEDFIMKNVVIALDRSNSQIPAVQAIALHFEVDKLNTKSVESVVEEIKRLMTIAGLENKIKPCDIMSALVNDTLLSDDSDPLHVSSFDFIPACDKALCGTHS